MKDTFLQLLDRTTYSLNYQIPVAEQCNVDQDYIEFYKKLLDHCAILKSLVEKSDLSVNYLNQFENDINLTTQSFSGFGHYDPNNIQDKDKNGIKYFIESSRSTVEYNLDLLQFNFDLFKKVGFFNNNIVAIGANGSGKTSLSQKLKDYLRNNGIVISAQRIMFVPKLETINNPTQTANDLKRYQFLDKSNKDINHFSHLRDEFSIILKNLLADNIAVGNSYLTQAREQSKQGITISTPPNTNLDKTFEIWNTLLEHKTIKCIDGINIEIESKENNPYTVMEMSDGEKVVLFLIAQVLQAPKTGFIVIDEPEMYLHKTILKKLWDILERERPDCIFIYLTHDLDFATSRSTAKKIWIRSFTYPAKWEIEKIPENELPESLLLELLGSRKNILFCEGQKGSIDEKVYNILFPNLTITPVGNCFSVINYTKAFNKITNPNIQAIGIIDSDHHNTTHLQSLKSEKIFSFSVTEIESLFLDEKFLKILAKQLLIEDEIIEKIKSEVINLLEKELELQVANYVSTKINYYFKESHVSKGNTLDLVQEHYSKFTQEVKISEWYELRKQEVQNTIIEKNYPKVLALFNNKGLKNIANKNFKISDFTDRAIKLLQFEPSTHEILKNHFPIELQE